MQWLRNSEPFVRALGAVITFSGGVVAMVAATLVYPPNALGLLIEVLMVVTLQMAVVLGVPKLSWHGEPLIVGGIFAISNVLIAVVTMCLGTAQALGLAAYVLAVVIIAQIVRYRLWEKLS